MAKLSQKHRWGEVCASAAIYADDCAECARERRRDLQLAFLVVVLFVLLFSLGAWLS